MNQVRDDQICDCSTTMQAQIGMRRHVRSPMTDDINHDCEMNYGDVSKQGLMVRMDHPCESNRGMVDHESGVDWWANAWWGAPHPTV